MADLCKIDETGKITERLKNNDDVFVHGVRYSQNHLAKHMDDSARSGLGFALVPTLGDAPNHDKSTHKAVVIEAGVGDDPVDSFEVVKLTPDEISATAKAELNISDLKDLPRVAEDFLGILLAKGVLKIKDFSPEAQAKIAARQMLRTKI